MQERDGRHGDSGSTCAQGQFRSYSMLISLGRRGYLSVLGSDAVGGPYYDVLSSPKLNRDEGCRAHQRTAHPESLAYFCEHFCTPYRCVGAGRARCYHRRHGEPNIAAKLEGGMALH